MRKAFAPSVFALATLFGATAIVVACSSSTDSEFPGDPPKPDADDGPISNLLTEGGGPDSGEGGPAASCSPAIPASFTPTWVPPTRVASACTPTQITGYYEACLKDAGVTEGDGTCAAYKAANQACTDCAEPVDKSGPIQWQLGRTFYTVNTAGCIAVQQADLDGGGNGCGEAYNAAVQCTRESCLTCITEAQSFPKFQDCQRAVGMQGVCKSFEDAKTPKCAGYNDPGSPAIPCFRASSSEAEETYFTRVVTLLCGPP